MQKTRDFLDSLGLPAGDRYDLPTSEKRFEDGAQYRFEVPGIQGPGAMRALLAAVDETGVPIHRITQTKGVMTLLDAEIEQMVEMVRPRGIELVLSIGPRATTDTSASVNTSEGSRMGYRLRGQEQVVRAVEEIRRGLALGVTSFMVYDEGALWLLGKMRAAGEIPAEVRFKVSAHTGHGNPCAARMLTEIGADSFNPIRDIQLQMLAAIRQAVDVPLDVHTENPASSGGFIRHYEVPEMVRVAAPIYLKTGGSVAKSHSWDTTDADAVKRMKQVQLVKRMLDAYAPDAVTHPPARG
ncbi:peptidase [Jannaschia marina]|uniref:peptidase n=1 Tax=Jannaschia marina TaxID=2741674 RepID=UPI0015CB8D07|nr:peptidase [Jannaschia marina]